MTDAPIPPPAPLAPEHSVPEHSVPEHSVPESVPPAVHTEAMRQHALLARGVAQILGGEKAGRDGLYWKLVQSLTRGVPLKVKLGMDPTAPDLHLGHAVVLSTMRQFQDLGHHVIPLVGDYTTLIGDPSGRNDTRPPLTPAEIAANAATYLAQACKVLADDPATLHIRHNSEWLGQLDFAATIQLCAQVTVAQIIQREDFANRLAQNTPIFLHELLYPVMQGYDSVMLGCDVELGGTDQTFNCLMGRHLMQLRGMNPQIVITLPLLEGLDGKVKMSKSKQNYIGLTEDPVNMFGKIMSIPDEIMPKYFQLLAPGDPISEHPQQHSLEHPMTAKKRLGELLVTRFHSAAAAAHALADFTTRFSKRETPDNLPTHTLTLPLTVVDVLVQLGFAQTNSEARRLVQQGAVKFQGTPVLDVQTQWESPVQGVFQAGKRNMAQIILAK